MSATVNRPGMACAALSAKFSIVAEQESAQRLAPRTGVGKQSEDETDDAVDDDELQADHRHSHESALEIEHARRPQSGQIGKSGLGHRGFGHRNQFRGYDTTGPADGPQHQHADGKRDGRDGSPRGASSIRRVRFGRFRKRLPQTRHGPLGDAFERLAGQFVDVGWRQSDHHSRSDEDQRAAAFDRTRFDRVGRLSLQRDRRALERQWRPARPEADRAHSPGGRQSAD